MERGGGAGGALAVSAQLGVFLGEFNPDLLGVVWVEGKAVHLLQVMVTLVCCTWWWSGWARAWQTFHGLSKAFHGLSQAFDRLSPTCMEDWAAATLTKSTKPTGTPFL